MKGALHGVALEYVNTVDGGPPLRRGLLDQMLRPGEVTKKHRHSRSTVIQRFAAGHNVINGKNYDGSRGTVSSCAVEWTA